MELGNMNGIQIQNRAGTYSAGVQNVKQTERADFEFPKVRKTSEPNQNLDKQYTKDELSEKIEAINNRILGYDKRVEFSVHEKTNRIMMKVVDTVTDEVIKELPPEKMLDIMAGIWEVAGILVDKKI